MTRPRAWCERPSIYEAQSESSLCDLIDRRKPSKRNLDIVPKCSSRHRACLREPFNSLEEKKGTPPSGSLSRDCITPRTVGEVLERHASPRRYTAAYDRVSWESA